MSKDTNPSSTISTWLKDSIIGQAAVDVAEENKFPLQTTCLAAMTIASHAVGSAFKVTTPSGRDLPIPLYAIAEQPSNSSKTSVVQDLYSGYADRATELNYAIDKERKEVKKSIEDKRKAGHDPHENELELLNNLTNIPIGTSDSTPEGLESSLTKSGGFFIAYSTEQGLSMTLLGAHYSEGKKKDDLILKAFNGEYHSVVRASDRVTFTGKPYGGVFELSQEGTIARIMSSAGSTGISERFLMLREGDLLGTREYLNKAHNPSELLLNPDSKLTKDMIASVKPVERTAFNQFKRQMAAMADIRKKNGASKVGDLKALTFSGEAWVLIQASKQVMEDEISVDKVRNAYLASMRGKVDLQVMKLAATIHCMDCDVATFGEIPTEINPDTVRTAFLIINELFNGVSKIADGNMLYGDNVEDEYVLEYIQDFRQTLTLTKLCQNLARQKQAPFRFYTKRGEARKKIEEALKRLVDSGRVFERRDRNPFIYTA